MANRTGEGSVVPVRRRDPDRKEKILAAAARLVSARGFHGVSMADVGAQVGISGTAVYRHFENKGALLLALFDRSLDDMLSRERMIVADADAAEALGQLIDEQVNFVVDQQEFARVYYREVAQLSDEDRVRLRRKQRLYVEEWVRLLREFDRTLDVASARVLVQSAIGAIQSALVHRSTLSGVRLKLLLADSARSVMGVPRWSR